MSAVWRGIYSDRVETKIIGQQWLDWLSSSCERSIKGRDRASAGQIFDIKYENTIQDPIGTLRQIYDYFGYSFSGKMEENLKQYISLNKQQKHGLHFYSLEQFGLERMAVLQKFNSYCKKFNIEEEL